MKLLFDLNATQPNHSGASHGGGKYGITVFFALLKRGVRMDCTYDSRLPLREDVKKAVEENSLRLHDISQKSLEEIAVENKIDTYYSANSISSIVQSNDVRNIITMHGLRNLEMPRDWTALRYKLPLYWRAKNLFTLTFQNLWKRKMLRRARKTLLNAKAEYVVVSEHTKYACLSYVPELNPAQIKVFYSPSTSTSNKDIPQYESKHKYALMVSGNRCEKNAIRAIKAFDEIFSDNETFRDFKVLITGAKNESDFNIRIKNKENFTFLGYVDETTLESLYKSAYIFVYPSINEGFGYPPLEAMHYGVPVAASAVCSIPEVCGDAALYFNPFDYKEIKGRILRLLLDSECRDEQARRSLKRYAQITERQNKDLVGLVDYILK